MRLTFKNFNKIMTDFAELQLVSEDAGNSANAKGIIFRVEQATGLVSLIAVSSMITYRRVLPTDTVLAEVDDVEYKNGFAYMQIDSKELIGFLSTYKTVRTTKVDSFTLETVNGSIKLTIVEVPKGSTQTSDDDSQLGILDIEDEYAEESDLVAAENTPPMISTYTFASLVINATQMHSISRVVPADAKFETTDSNVLKLYTSTLLGLMGNGTNIYSFMTFKEDYVSAMSPNHASFIRNMLVSDNNDIFKDIRLNYKVLLFIDKVICSGSFAGVAQADGVQMLDSVEVTKQAEYLMFKSDGVEAFMLYDSQLIDMSATTQMYLDTEGKYDKDNYAIFDRCYFKDIIKRLAFKNETVNVCMNRDDKTVEVSNSVYDQVIIPTEFHGFENVQTGKVSFRIMPDIINKAIIGADTGDSSFESENSTVKIIYSNGGDARHQGIVFADTSDAWFSIVRVRVQ